jgi:hypothetical protein
METTEKRIIEINGIKMEVDLRNARVIDEYKVGDNIKVLVKEYGSEYKSFVGTIIGFDNFKLQPTVVIAYLKTRYDEATIEYIYFNESTKDVEITQLNDWDIPITKTEILKRFDKIVETKQREIADTENKKKLFETLFGKFFESRVHIDVV